MTEVGEGLGRRLNNNIMRIFLRYLDMISERSLFMLERADKGERLV